MKFSWSELFSITRVVIFISLLLSTTNVIAEDRVPPDGPTLNSTFSSLHVEDLTGHITPEDLASMLVGAGVTVSNVTYKGADIAAGTFTGGSEVVGFDSGVILSSGSLMNVIGPNQYDNISTNNSLEGDADLTVLSGYETYDASVLEFDFFPNRDFVSFQFVFASDEYNEFVNSSFNDVFGFFINGQNCAIVEGDPISVNTINNGNPYGSNPRSHTNFYKNNDLSDGGGAIDTEMDGLTEVLTCSASVNPYHWNHMKLAIADASDHMYDGNVFIKAASITTARRPIILVPGMFASFNLSCLSEVGDCDDDEWQWMPVKAEDVYRPLIQRLNDSYYTEENGYLTIFFYDWRKPIESNIPLLKSKIQEVKDKTGAEKVDLIGHSMGGLLSRAYVQDSNYAYDVGKLITLGSPHFGSAKAYPYWEAAYFYEVDPLEEIGLSLVLTYYMVRQINPIPVVVIRDVIPSNQNLLPLWNYVYDSKTNNQKPEAEMVHRNNFLRYLNNNVNLLFNRLGENGVATFAGTDVTTTERFYVDDFIWWLHNPREWLNWDDGKPDWSRLGEFKNNEGDGTVLVNSALLPQPAYSMVFGEERNGGVDHSELVGYSKVIDEIFSFLDISLAPLTQPQIMSQALVMFLDGPANAIVTDPLGRILRPLTEAPSVPSEEVPSDEKIPGAEYLIVPGDVFKYIIIEDPVEGKYQIQVEGQNSGYYTIGLLDTFDQTNESFSDILEEWDTARSQIEPAATTTFSITYSAATTNVVLIAETPLINAPVYANAHTISGRAKPGVTVEIYDETDNSLLGSGIADAYGLFEIQLNRNLKLFHKIFPKAASIVGVPVDVLPISIYIPLINR